MIKTDCFAEIELTTSDLFDNPNIIDLSVLIEQLLNEKGITQHSEPVTPKQSIRERKLSIPAVRAQELAQIEFVENYNAKKRKEEQETAANGTEEMKEIAVDTVDRTDIRRKISSAVFDLATETITVEDLNSKGFTELGMDSLSIVDFVNRLNEKYFPGDDITASDVFDYPTVNELTDHITRKKSMSLGTAPVLTNGTEVVVESVHAEMEGIEKEKEKNAELLTLAYLLVENDVRPFSSTMTLSSNGATYQLTSSTNGNVITQLNPDGGQEKELQKHLSQDSKILIQLDNLNDSVEKVYMTLLNFIKALSKNRIKCQFAVSPKFSLGNSIARAFMKTVTSEKYPLIGFEWDQEIQQVSFVSSEEPIKGSWLITGGLSGIGFEIGNFIANGGADNVILISRRQPTQQILEQIRAWKAKVSH